MKKAVIVTTSEEERLFSTVEAAANHVGFKGQTVRNYFSRNKTNTYRRRGITIKKYES